MSQVKGTLVAGESVPGRGPGLCDDQKHGQGSQGGLRGWGPGGTAAEGLAPAGLAAPGGSAKGSKS